MNNKISKLQDNHEKKTLAVRKERQSRSPHRKLTRKIKKPKQKTQINPFHVSPIKLDSNPSRKLLLKISLFEKKQNKAFLNLHHDGQCDTLHIPAESSTSSISFHSTYSCSQFEPKNIQEICQVVEHASISLPWKRVRYQVLEAAVGSSATRQRPRNKPSGPRYSTSILKQRCRYKPKTSFTQTLLTSSSGEVGSIIQKTKNSSMQTILIPKVQKKECRLKQKINIYDYHQKSKGVQKSSEIDLELPMCDTNVFTAVRATKSTGSISHDSIVDLFHALNWDTFSDRQTVNSSEPSLFDVSEKFLNKQSNFSQTVDQNRDSNELRLTKSDRSLVRKLPIDLDIQKTDKSYLQFFQKYLNDCKDKIRPAFYDATQTTPLNGSIVNKVFPVLTPSGEQIGTLIGGSAWVKRPKMHTKQTQIPDLHFPTATLHQYNTTEQRSKINQLSGNLRKNYQKPIEFLCRKHKQSTGLQTEKPILQDIQLDEELTLDTPAGNKNIPSLLETILNPDIKAHQNLQVGASRIARFKKSNSGVEKNLGKKATQHVSNTEKLHLKEIGSHAYLRYVMKKPDVEPILEEVKEIIAEKVDAATSTYQEMQHKRSVVQHDELIEL